MSDEDLEKARIEMEKEGQEGQEGMEGPQ